MNLALLVNGKRREGHAEATLLDVIQEVGIELPALCHDPRVKPGWGIATGVGTSVLCRPRDGAPGWILVRQRGGDLERSAFGVA